MSTIILSIVQVAKYYFLAGLWFGLIIALGVIFIAPIRKWYEQIEHQIFDYATAKYGDMFSIVLSDAKIHAIFIISLFVSMAYRWPVFLWRIIKRFIIGDKSQKIIDIPKPN